MAIKNERQLKSLLEPVLKNALNNIAQQVREELKSNLMNDWYMRPGYKPSEQSYERTYELYQSITAEPVKKRGNEFDVNVFFDLTKIKAYARLTGFNAHMSLGNIASYEGKPISWWLINWIDQGVEPREDGSYFGNQPIDGIYMFDKTKKWIESGNLDSIIRRVFASNGFKIKKLK